MFKKFGSFIGLISAILVSCIILILFLMPQMLGRQIVLSFDQTPNGLSVRGLGSHVLSRNTVSAINDAINVFNNSTKSSAEDGIEIEFVAQESEVSLEYSAVDLYRLVNSVRSSLGLGSSRVKISIYCKTDCNLNTDPERFWIQAHPHARSINVDMKNFKSEKLHLASAGLALEYYAPTIAAIIYLKIEEIDRAEELLIEVSRDPIAKNVDHAHFLLSLIAAMRADVFEAGEWRKKISNNPFYYERSLQSGARVFLSLGMYEEALSYTKQLSDRYSSPVTTALLQHNALRGLGRHTDALEVIENALSGDPDDKALKTVLASGYSRIGRVGESWALVQELLREDPANESALQIATTLLLKMDDQDPRIQSYLDRLKRNADGGKDHSSIAIVQEIVRACKTKDLTLLKALIEGIPEEFPYMALSRKPMTGVIEAVAGPLYTERRLVVCCFSFGC